jgi:hypothetical protein
VGFLRRLVGGGHSGGADKPAENEPDDTTADADGPDDAERARELEVLREDQARQDDLIRRQQRYASYAWEPPKQGGDRRSDDGQDDGADSR